MLPHQHEQMLCQRHTVTPFDITFRAHGIEICCMELFMIGIEVKYNALQPPFNEEARAAAGFGPEWYLPLSSVTLR